MNLMKKLWLAIAVTTSMSVLAQVDSDSSVSADREMESTQKFIEAKREVSLRNKLVDFTLGGDLRLRYQHFKESVGGLDQRSEEPSNVYEAEFNLLVDYAADKSWASVLMRFKNNLGMSFLNGTIDNIEMKKALVGYTFYEKDNSKIGIRAGRDSGYNMFDSRVQFAGNYDGVWLRYDDSFEEVGDFYVDFGPFVVDSEADHYAWIGETGLKDIGDTGAFLKYSFINWSKKGGTLEPGLNGAIVANSNYWKFQNHQMLVGYVLNPEVVGAVVKTYAAYGLNTKADVHALTSGSKANRFWYAGVTAGDILQAGWAVDVCYQSVGAQAIPDTDISGISNGNAAGNIFYDGTNALGRGNYKGWAVKSGYAITQNTVLGLEYEISRAKNTNIGGQHKYSHAEAHVIYAF